MTMTLRNTYAIDGVIRSEDPKDKGKVLSRDLGKLELQLVNAIKTNRSTMFYEVAVEIFNVLTERIEALEAQLANATPAPAIPATSKKAAVPKTETAEA